jgi:hypothetical protein
MPGRARGAAPCIRPAAVLAVLITLFGYGCLAASAPPVGASFTGQSGNAGNTFGSAAVFYSAVVMSDAPLGYWRLDESTGTTAVDRSGNGWNGSYTGGPTLRRPGALAADPSTALGLDGADDGMTAPDRNDFLGLSPFSIEAWVNPSTLGPSGDYNTVLRKYGGSGYWVWLNPDYGVGFERMSTGAIDQLRTGALPLTGSWHHIVATFDGATMRIYVDGTERVSRASNQSITDTAATLQFGYYPSWVNGSLAGSIDELAVYGTALSAARVSAHYAKGTTG